ncbi:hypothetical protein HDV00_000042 [Rhizophlyctis rosea]|nr:hypothetical protein HDV00_000042 [Rhizophlyctis rosea]
MWWPGKSSTPVEAPLPIAPAPEVSPLQPTPPSPEPIALSTSTSNTLASTSQPIVTSPSTEPETPIKSGPRSSKPIEESSLPHQIFVYFFSFNSHNRDRVRAHFGPDFTYLLQAGGAGFFGGGLFGAWMAGQKRALQFLAENAHRQPSTVPGWYNYHKHKNWHVIGSGVNGFVKMGTKFAGVTTAFACTELGLEKVTGKKSCLNTLAAGVGTTLAFSSIYRLGWQYNKYALMWAGVASSLFGTRHHGAEFDEWRMTGKKWVDSLFGSSNPNSTSTAQTQA